nr:transposon, En/Spm-like, transposase-associated domain protein [Tanacetum cinerariifolium]
MHEITNPELIKRLRDILKSVDEMIRVTTAFLREEVAVSNQAQKKTLSAWKQQEARQKKLTEGETSRISRGDEDGAKGPMIIEVEIGEGETSRISRGQSEDVTSSHSSQNPQRKLWI